MRETNPKSLIRRWLRKPSSLMPSPGIKDTVSQRIKIGMVIYAFILLDNTVITTFESIYKVWQYFKRFGWIK